MCEKHGEDGFSCRVCEKYKCADIDKAKRHLDEFHKINVIDKAKMVEVLDYPKDNRHYKCLKCAHIFIAQDVGVVLEHMKKFHARTMGDTPQDGIIMSCRCCCARFYSEEELVKHGNSCLKI